MKQLMGAFVIAAVFAFGTVGVLSFGPTAQAHDPKKKDKLEKKAIEIAGDLTFAMADSGAYTSMDADAFADFAIQVATRVVHASYSEGD